MLFYHAEGCHLRAVGCSAGHSSKAHDEQSVKIVTRIVSPGIGNLVKGGEKDVHADNIP